MYNLIEKLVDACIPLWDLTLAPLRHPKFEHQCRIQYKKVVYLPESKDSPAETDKTEVGPHTKEVVDRNEYVVDSWDSEEESEAENSGEEDENEKDEADVGPLFPTDTTAVVRPEPTGPFSPLPIPPKFSLKEEYGQKGLQIIVKLANIELTPENPKYDGGSWHLEGQMVSIEICVLNYCHWRCKLN